MTIEINWVILAIIIAVIIVMAIIGYVAEGTELAKNKEEKAKEKEKKDEVEEIKEDIENAPSAWTGEIKTEDPAHEQVHTVATVDDWSSIPTEEIDSSKANIIEQVDETNTESINELEKNTTNELFAIPNDRKIEESIVMPVENNKIQQTDNAEDKILNVNQSEKNITEELLSNDNQIEEKKELPTETAEVLSEFKNQMPIAEEKVEIVEPKIEMPEIFDTPIEQNVSSADENNIWK